MKGHVLIAEGKRFRKKANYRAGGLQHQSVCFAVIRFHARAYGARVSGTEQRLQDVEGVYQARVDAARHTIHILYNGDPRTIHRVCTRVCETGLDVVAYLGPHELPGHPDTGLSQAMSGAT